MIPPAPQSDWEVFWKAFAGGLCAVVPTIAAGVKFVTKWLDNREQKYQDFVKTVIADQKRENEEFRNTNKELASAVKENSRENQKTIKDLATDWRKETNKTVEVLLNIQQEAVGAVGELSHNVQRLGAAVDELRRDMERVKAVNPHPPEATAGS